jgi:hypothetical protein
VVALVLLGCDGGSKQDAGVDAGSSSEQVRDAGSCSEQAAAAATERFSGTCFALGAGSSSEVTFRLRNASSAQVWVPQHEWFGATCRATIFVSGCQGGVLSSTGLTSELCPENLLSLAPDASVDLPPLRPSGEVSTTCGGWGVPLPAGSYQVQFSYSLDGGPSFTTSTPYPFSLSADSGVIEVQLP